MPNDTSFGDAMREFSANHATFTRDNFAVPITFRGGTILVTASRSSMTRELQPGGFDVKSDYIARFLVSDLARLTPSTAPILGEVFTVSAAATATRLQVPVGTQLKIAEFLRSSGPTEYRLGLTQVPT